MLIKLSAVITVTNMFNQISNLINPQEHNKPRNVAVLIENGTFISTLESAELLQEIGGRDAILRMTALFYEKFSHDLSISKFLYDSKNTPHHERLGNWICEKMDSNNKVWSEERQKRAKCPFSQPLSNGEDFIVHDRSSAHRAAWFSVLRPPEEMGQRFKLTDARVWMRLFFWAARECGLLENKTFQNWLVRFIAHFIRVYEYSAPAHAVESLEWSSNAANIEQYLATREMEFFD